MVFFKEIVSKKILRLYNTICSWIKCNFLLKHLALLHLHLHQYLKWKGWHWSMLIHGIGHKLESISYHAFGMNIFHYYNQYCNYTLLFLSNFLVLVVNLSLLVSTLTHVGSIPMIQVPGHNQNLSKGILANKLNSYGILQQLRWGVTVEAPNVLLKWQLFHSTSCTEEHLVFHFFHCT